MNEALTVWAIVVLRDERYFTVNGVILGVVREKKTHEIMMVMMILFTAIKILSFYGKQNRNALQHKKKCIDSKYALFALRNRCAISTLTTMSISVVAMKTLQIYNRICI